MRYFYRLVETDPPTREQFAPYYELGVTPPGASGRELHLSKGVSMFETEDQARQASPTMKTRYDFIAEVRGRKTFAPSGKAVAPATTTSTPPRVTCFPGWCVSWRSA